MTAANPASSTQSAVVASKSPWVRQLKISTLNEIFGGLNVFAQCPF